MTGVGTVAGGILRNLSVDGLLRVTPTLLTGDALRLRSDKLTGSINLAVDLRNLPSPATLAMLEAVAARHFGADPARVVALPGTEIGLRLLGALGLELPTVSIGPETTRAARAAGVRVVEEAETHDLDGLVAAVARAAV